jgi:hypothetical protein
MLKQILRVRTVLMFSLCLSLFCPQVFAQGHQEGRNGGNAGTINRGSGAYGTLPPGYTTVVVGGNTYYYGENTYFRQMPVGGFVVVTPGKK